MPFYEYRCQSCGHELEALQKISDEPLKDCPDCEDGQLRRLVSAAAFRLKGGGWYETDFKTGNKRNVAGDDGGAGKPKADGDKAGADAKPAPAKAGAGADAKKAKTSESKPGSSSPSAT